MRGKKPKERKNYILRTENETLVEVTREVYLEWYQSRRREKYQQEQKQKYGVCSLDVVQEGSFAKTSISQEGQPEEMAVRSECLKKFEGEFRTVTGTGGISDLSVFFEEVTVKKRHKFVDVAVKQYRTEKNEF